MNYYLSLAALIPAVILFVRIYQLDHIEKEPRRLLGKLVLFGAQAAWNADPVRRAVRPTGGWHPVFCVTGVGRRTEPALGGVFAAG